MIVELWKMEKIKPQEPIFIRNKMLVLKSQHTWKCYKTDLYGTEIDLSENNTNLHGTEIDLHETEMTIKD